MDELTREDNAHHEAAHATLAYLFDFEIINFSIDPLDKNRLAHIELEDIYTNQSLIYRYCSTSRLAEKDCIQLLVGSMAKDKFKNQEWSPDSLGGKDDIDKVKSLIENMITPGQIQPKLGELSHEARIYLNDPVVWKTICVVAEVMLKNGDFSKKGLYQLLDKHLREHGKKA